MSFIDGSYFTGEIMIPNLDQEVEEGETYNSEINQAISQYQKEVLTDLLGYSLYKALIADLDGNGNPQSQRFIDLINGAEFSNDYRFTQTLKWNGFANAEKKSLIAYFTYYKWLKKNHSHLSDVGNTKPEAENAERFDPTFKAVNAWQRMLDLYGEVPEEYSEVIPSVLQASETCLFNDEPSAYNFLYANKETYPEWIFKPKWTINSFGL